MGQNKERILDLFFRLMMGEGISVAGFANEYNVSTKSISRDLNEIKNFSYEHRELLSNAEIKYHADDKKHYLELEHFLEPNELFAITKIILGSRSLSKTETVEIISKLKNYVSKQDRDMLNELIASELYSFNEINHDCKNVIDNIWKLTNCIRNHKEITVEYFKMSRERVERRIRPLAITFSDYYFYLICSQKMDDDSWEIRYYRVDRIVRIIEHRTKFRVHKSDSVNEGDLMNKIQYMQPGGVKRIRFAFNGPSVQAVLDRIPTANLVEKKDGECIIEAEVIGSGVKMFLLSQGAWVQPLAPKDFVDEMREEVEKMRERYGE